MCGLIQAQLDGKTTDLATLQPRYHHTVIIATGLLKLANQSGNVAPPGKYN